MATVQEKAMCVLRFFETKTVIKRQGSYRIQYGKDRYSDNAIGRWLKQFQEAGSVAAAIETVTQQMLENT
jgi:ketopantoate hydroxymethyltransferase